MGFEFKQEHTPVIGRVPKNRKVKTADIEIISEDDLTQNIMSEEEETKMALEYLMETQQYNKFLIWLEIKKTAGF